MATLRPSLHSSGSYQRTRSPAPSKERLQPQQLESCHRSRSHSRNPKPYDPDSPKRYRPNESRSRKPPQSPKVEDGGSGDDGVRMRGKLEQRPVIIDLDSKGEPLPFKPSQEPGPVTPPSSDDSYSDSESDLFSDSPQPAKNEIRPVCRSDRASKSTVGSDGRQAQEKTRSRPSRPSIDTGAQRNGSLPSQMPQIERARSPYASTPRQKQTEDPRRFSEEPMLSPTPLNSKDYGPRPCHRSQQPPDLESRRHENQGSGSGSGSDKDKKSSSNQRANRPTLDRRASAMPQLESASPRTPTSQRPGQYYSSSDDSEYGEKRHRANSSQNLSDSRTKVGRSSVGNSVDGEKQKHEEKQTHAKRPSPPRSPATTEFPKWGQSLNREALLNVSAALSGTGAAPDSHQRKASPRPSPQISPKHSPYPSPPGTPPEPHQHGGNSVSNLKNDPPKSNSRPTSPLTSIPSSPKRVGSDYMSARGEQEPRPSSHSHHSYSEGKPRPPYPSEVDAKQARASHQSSQDTRPLRYAPRSRATSPLPPTRRAEPEPPKIDVRSPSPLPQRSATHSGSSVPDKRDSRTPSRYMPDYASGATLQPARPDRRQRSLSNADARGSRPTNLTINPVVRPVIHQADVEYLSPTSENTPAHLHSSPQHISRPSLLSSTSVDGRSRTSSLAEAGPSTHRSRSSVPAPDAAAPRANSAAPPPANRHRSRSSASVSTRALSDQPAPGALPLCPRPDPVSGYNDWYTLEGCDTFAICPDCRNAIFGLGYERFFKLRSANQQSRKIHCQMNDPWVRMATISSITSKQPDVTFLTKLANIGEDYEPCPGPKPAERDWYRVEDENAAEDDHLADFQVCTHCVHSIEVILPTLKGTFFRYKGHQVDTTPRPCSLRFDPNRFAQYIDKCQTSAQEAARTRKEPDMSDFVWFHKKETVISECTREHALIGRDWHLNALIPELAICEMCYYDTVRPLSTPPNSYHLAKAVSPVPKHISNDVSCQLYSPRMKEIFDRACREDDAEYLKQAVLTRRKLQVEILAARMAVQQRPDEWKAQKELDDLMDNWRRLEKKRH